LKLASIAFLNNVEQSLTTYNAESGNDHSALEISLTKIDEALQGIQTTLVALSTCEKESLHDAS